MNQVQPQPGEHAAAFRALVVDDEQLFARAVARELGRRDVAADVAYTAAEALERAATGEYQVILLDHKLPDDDGIRIIPKLLARQPDCSVVVMTAYQTIPSAVQAMRQGAEDYIVKEATTARIVERVLEVRRREAVRSELTDLQEHKRDGLLGRSPGIVNVVRMLEQVAASADTTVLLVGESGAGKEVAVQHLHRLSTRPGSPLVTVDCVALPANLVESLLFGHEKGSFTGAERSTEGHLEAAAGGTVFLDEIGDMDPALQGKLLRVLENRTFQRLGSSKLCQVRARIVAATNRDLLQQVRQGTFRFDLYERLSVFPVHLPPLRERGEDVLLLAEHFLGFYAQQLGKPIEPLPLETRQALLAYDYPGNVRELKNAIERAVIIAESGRIEARHLPERMVRRAVSGPERRTPPNGVPVDFVPGVDTLESLERRMIQEALGRSRGVKTEAARLLGISRFQLLRRLEKFGIRSDEDRGSEG
ncbi:MAG: sigma-54-dependent Fis family transcriptional regulator [Deltaproteobacteria bacterium]|nr:sigma-54-dependent Fis family transcriptional regulator [Deltaproteobacteria bacterium]